MTREQLAQLTTVEDLNQLRLSIKEEFDQFRNYVKALRNDLEQAGAIKPERLHYSPTEFAEKLGVSKRVVFNWCHDGTISASQPNGFGCTWIIPVSELERMTVEGYGRRKAKQ